MVPHAQRAQVLCTQPGQLALEGEIRHVYVDNEAECHCDSSQPFYLSLQGADAGQRGLSLALRAIAAAARKSCDEDAGGCGALLPVRLALPFAPPRCFVLQLAWASAAESGAVIAATLACLQEVLRMVAYRHLWTVLAPFPPNTPPLFFWFGIVGIPACQQQSGHTQEQ